MPAYYPFLDGLRTIAILWVVVHHLNHFFKLSSFLPAAISWNVERFAFLGSLGVDIFFVTSGFLITGLLLKDVNGKPDPRRFYLRRCFKIIPQYVLLILTVLALAQVVGLQEADSRLLGYLFFVQGYIHPIASLGHLWSIGAEEFFYVLYPGIILLAVYTGKTGEARRRNLMIMCAAAMIAVLIGRRATFLHWQHLDVLLAQMPHMRMDELLAGCMIKLAEPFLTQRLAKRLTWFPAACFAASMGLFYYFFYHFDPGHYMTYVYVYVAAGTLLISALCGFRPLAFLNSKWFGMIGKSSYGIYLWHYPLIFLAVRGLPTQGVSPLCAVLFGVILIGIGIFMTKTVEAYFLRVRDRLIP